MTDTWQAPVALGQQSDLRLMRLARELAMELTEVSVILARYGITDEEWQRLQRHPKFQQILAAEAAAWDSALNTHERVRLKAAAMMEEWLPEAYARMHDRNEALPAKTEVAKLVTRLAGMGIERTGAGEEGAQKFSLVINIGDGRAHRVVGDGQELKIIEGKAA